MIRGGDNLPTLHPLPILTRLTSRVAGSLPQQLLISQVTGVKDANSPHQCYSTLSDKLERREAEIESELGDCYQNLKVHSLDSPIPDTTETNSLVFDTT